MVMASQKLFVNLLKLSSMCSVSLLIIIAEVASYFVYFDQSFNILSCLVVRKPVIGVSDPVQHKRGCTATEDS